MDTNKYKTTVFAFGVIFLLLLSFFKWELIGSRDKIRPTISLSQKEQIRIKSQYAEVTQEIRLRIGNEHDLFLYQFLLIGGILSITLGKLTLSRKNKSDNTKENKKGFTLELFYKSGAFILILGFCAVALLLVNIHIRYNAMVIEELGEWVYNNYESTFANPALGWEHFLKINAPYHSSFYFQILIGLLYFPTVLVLLTYYFVVYKNKLKEDPMAQMNRIVFLVVQVILLLFTIFNHFGIPCNWWRLAGWILLVISFGIVTSGGYKKIKEMIVSK